MTENLMSKTEEKLEAKYGLPEKVFYCKKCVLSNQVPCSTPEFLHVNESKHATMPFNTEGICDACRFAEQKEQIDWKKREKDLVASAAAQLARASAWAKIRGSGFRSPTSADDTTTEKASRIPNLSSRSRVPAAWLAITPRRKVSRSRLSNSRAPGYRRSDTWR